MVKRKNSGHSKNNSRPPNQEEISILQKIVEVLKKLIALYQELIKKLSGKKGPGEETIEEMIRRIAAEEGVDPDLAVRVALCESGLDPKAKHLNPDGTIDRGLYQWNDYWHPEVSDADAYDPEKATRLFCKAVREGHLNWWNSSRSCWEK
jgi:hypothetical protein